MIEMDKDLSSESIAKSADRAPTFAELQRAFAAAPRPDKIFLPKGYRLDERGLIQPEPHRQP